MDHMGSVLLQSIQQHLHTNGGAFCHLVVENNVAALLCSIIIIPSIIIIMQQHSVNFCLKGLY